MVDFPINLIRLSWPRSTARRLVEFQIVFRALSARVEASLRPARGQRADQHNDDTVARAAAPVG